MLRNPLLSTLLRSQQAEAHPAAAGDPLCCGGRGEPGGATSIGGERKGDGERPRHVLSAISNAHRFSFSGEKSKNVS